MTTALLIVNGLVISYKGDDENNVGVLTVTDPSTGEEEVIHDKTAPCANFIALAIGAIDIDCSIVSDQLPDTLIPWLEQDEE
jgi:hypothetical protein